MLRNFILTILCLCCITATSIYAQTIDKPVQLTLTNGDQNVAPGATSYVTMQFKIPYGLWMGAEGPLARTPSGTLIVVPEIEGFTFEKPHFPEPQEQWVPAKLGKSLAYTGIVNVVIPFTLNSSVTNGNYNLDFKVTYTPGYGAGKLSTHNNQIISTSVTVSKDGARGTAIPSPSTMEVSSDFVVGPLTHPSLGFLDFVYDELDESKGFTKFMHKVGFLDKPGHGKNLRLVPVPFLRTTNVEASSFGAGVSILNSTKEGTMTGSISLLGYSNTLIDGAVGIEAVSCPGAYHNYQLSAYVGGESYHFVTLNYENFTVFDSKFGYNVNLRSINEPRQRFYGVGPQTVEEDETAFELNTLGGVLDLYALPLQNFRVGFGASYFKYNVGRSFQDLIDEDFNDNDVQFLQDSDLVESTLGLDGASSFSIRANFIFDHKDQEFAPARGFVSKLTLYRTSINDIPTDQVDIIAKDFFGLDLNVSQYFSGPSQKWIVLLRGGLSLKSESNLPFYMLSSLGGANDLRAYDQLRWLDQHSAFASGEVRYTLTKIPVLGYPMSIEMAAFLDVGQVFGDSDFGDDINVDPGISLRMINKPNVGVIFNYSYGEDGGYFSGGIGLPF